MDEPYNPYSLLTFIIEGQKMAGRPFEFDSEVTNFDEMKNSKGKYIKPIKASTICPKCGQGLIVDLDLPDPPFAEINVPCEYCKVNAPFIDPFINPVGSNRISALELNPSIQPHTELFNAGQTVAERRKLQDNLSNLSDLEKFKLNLLNPMILPQEVFEAEKKVDSDPVFVREAKKKRPDFLDPLAGELVPQEVIKPVVNTGLILEKQKRVLPAADIDEEREVVDPVTPKQHVDEWENGVRDDVRHRLESLEEDV